MATMEARPNPSPTSMYSLNSVSCKPENFLISYFSVVNVFISYFLHSISSERSSFPQFRTWLHTSFLEQKFYQYPCQIIGIHFPYDPNSIHQKKSRLQHLDGNQHPLPGDAIRWVLALKFMCSILTRRLVLKRVGLHILDIFSHKTIFTLISVHMALKPFAPTALSAR